MSNKQKLMAFFRENSIIIFLSVFFAIAFSFANMGVDDIGEMRVEGGNLLSYWNKSINFYHIWSSRLLVNFIIFIFTDNNIIFWAVFVGFSMFLLLIAFKELFAVNDNKTTEMIFMSCMVMLYPWNHLSSAGWIATVTTYFSPIAFGMISLIPIKKVLNGEKIIWWKFLLYLICLIYGANNEQMMVVILLSYLVTLIWHFIVNRKIDIYLSLCTIASIGSAVFTFTCPGNANRKITSIAAYFHSFEHLNFIDKAELGYETTAYWLIFSDSLFIEITCLLLLLMVFLKYKDSCIRMVSAIPFITTIAFGPLKMKVARFFAGIINLSAEIPYFGLVNPDNRGGLGPYAEFLVMSICLAVVLIDIFLLCREWKQFIVSATLIAGGFASRLAMGFSPTIYTSDVRTNSIMCFCIIAVMVYIYSINKNLFKTDGQSFLKEKYVLEVMTLLAVFSGLNLIYIIYTTFA